MNYDVPILFIVYRNPTITKKVFQQIKKIKPNKLYIASDGYPQNHKKIQNEVKKTREIFNDIGWKCSIKKKFSNHNQGLKKGVVSAIDWFFQHEKQGIILEYDCFPSVAFFEYCKVLLKKYKKNNEIYSISGSNLTDNKKWSENDYFCTSLTPVWGWATWQRSWKLYKKKINYRDLNTILLKIKKQYAFPYNIFLKNNYKNNFKNINQSTWSFNFMFHQILKNKKCILPKYNLIKNLGFGKKSTNAHLTLNIYGDQKIHNLKIKNILHSKKLIVNYNADNILLKKCFKYMYLSYIQKKIKNFFK